MTFNVDFLGRMIYNKLTFPCSSMVEQEAVNFEVASSSLAGGAIFLLKNAQKIDSFSLRSGRVWPGEPQNKKDAL